MLTIGIIGTRGIPNRYGGFERFVELLVADHCWQQYEVRFKVYGEGPAHDFNSWTQVRDVGVSKAERPLYYYIKSTRLATAECDMVFCCGVGLSLVAFWPRLQRKALVINPDGCEWRRTKWSWIGRQLIRAMYLPALAAADRVVIDAEALREDFGHILGRKSVYIGYQAPAPGVTRMTDSTRNRLGLRQAFVLVIARLEPENNIQTIVTAFHELAEPGLDLIVVGGTDTHYAKEVLAPLATGNVRFVGPIYEQSVLDELRSNCAAYVHGHSVGGTNPSLLEALATVGGHLFCHDNKYNREVAGTEANYFADAHQLAQLLRRVHPGPGINVPTQRTPSRAERFRPDHIAMQYLQVFKGIHASR